MSHAFCFLSSVPVRRSPDDSTEMVNQLIFGDVAEVLDDNGKWLLIRGKYDGYEGWVDAKQLHMVDTPPVTDCVTTELSTPVTIDSMTVIAPAGSNCNSMWLASPPAAHVDAITMARRFLGTPYLWGGRTFMGIDCSGLVQIVAKCCGVALPRDASQQATCGTTVEWNKRQKGMLAFFANNEGRVVHVGIMADNDTIIHASGYVRCNRIDCNGILNDGLNGYTHQLFSIRDVGLVC